MIKRAINKSGIAAILILISAFSVVPVLAQTQAELFYPQPEEDEHAALHEFKDHPEFFKYKSDFGGVELLQHRTANRKIFLNPDGSYSQQEGLLPLHYKDEQGRWLSYTEDVSVSEANADYLGLYSTDLPLEVNVKDASSRLALSKGITLENNAGDIEIYDKHFNKVDQIGLKSNASGSVVDDRIAFENLWNGVDKKFELNTINGITSEYIIKEPLNTGSLTDGYVVFWEDYRLPEGFKFSYNKQKVETIGYAPAPKNQKFAAERDLIYITDTKDKQVGHISNPYIFDSREVETKEAWVAAKCDFISPYLVREIDDTHLRLGIVVPVSWLSAADRVYPVIIDPTASATKPQYGNVRGYGYSSTCQENLNVNVPTNSWIYNVATSYYINARNGGWRSEQRSRLGGPGGFGPTFTGCCNSGGGQSYSYNAAPSVATGLYSGNVPFRWQAYRTWDSDGLNYCDTYNQYRYNNWVVTVTYTPGCVNISNGSTITPTCSEQTINVGSGERRNFNVVAGAQYRFRLTTCPSGWTMQLTGRNTSDTQVFQTSGSCTLTYNWTATFTGTLRLNINRNSCLGYQGGSSAVLGYRQNPAGSGGTTTWLGAVSGTNNWNVDRNWSACRPNINVHADIPNTGQQPGITASSAAKTLTIATGRTLTVACTNCLQIGDP